MQDVSHGKPVDGLISIRNVLSTCVVACCPCLMKFTTDVHQGSGARHPLLIVTGNVRGSGEVCAV